ncbi:phage tail tape measure protein [Bacteroides thetaiotaomicron]|uniref:phage tail tape measure protein n=1 Tax=Bacteroides thetaiotaomicron TaxID=818 RepID=UPI00216494D0|nr:phage tail tape measure protein [Bacteroides thetaiotaomicron]UVR91026.1 phage tail tape measure protein [Bacteroides thetaiotaomicron]
MSKVDNRGIKIYLDTTNYKQGINEIVSQTEKYKKKLEDLEKSGKGTTLAAQKLRSEISKLQQQEKEHRGQLKETERILNNLSGVTYNELIAVKRKLQNELRLEQRGTEQYNTTLRQYKRVCTEITLAQREMNIEIGCQGTAWGKTANFINKYIGLAGTVLGMITGISLKLNQLREKRNEREDVKADVQALTGLSEESIGWLEQQAIRLSTTVTESGIRIRQSATEIMDAYKLVGSAKPELLSNKEALAAVTEQTLILASASGMTLKDAVDAVTLSLNQYGDGADQAARYANVMAAGSKYGSAAVESVTKSIKSSGVAAASANIPIEQLVGTIETLGEKGIKDEIAGTGLKRFFLTLQTGADDTNPKIVGLETALDNLQKKQLSATKIKKMFGEEGYNVASVLINEAEKVKYYTEAVTGTSVAMEQAATKSDTAAAKLAQAKNKMNEMGIELMEKLNPAIVSVMNSTTSWTGKLVDLISFLGKHSSAIITLTTIIGIYIAALKLENFWTAQTTVASKEYIAMQKLRLYWDKIVTASTLIYTAVTATLTGNLKAAKVAMKELFLIMKLSPFALIASLIVGVIAVSYKWNKAIRERYDIQKTMNKLHEKSAKLYEEEKEQVGKLWNTIHDGNKSLDERRTAITKLQEIMPEYRAQINEEGKVINETTTKLDDMNAALNRNIKLKTLREELFDRYKSIEKLERSPALKDNSLMGSMAREDVRTKIADEKKVLEALKKEYSAVFSEKFKKERAWSGKWYHHYSHPDWRQ